MKLAEAIALVEDGMTLDKSIPASEAVREICSGGVKASETDEPPALYLTESMAADAWQREANDLIYAFGYYRMRYVSLPKMETVHITMMGKDRTHRVTSDRYYVTSRIAFAKDDDAEGAT